MPFERGSRCLYLCTASCSRYVREQEVKSDGRRGRLDKKKRGIIVFEAISFVSFRFLFSFPKILYRLLFFFFFLFTTPYCGRRVVAWQSGLSSIPLC